MPLSSIKAFYYKSTERSEDREKLADVGVSPHVCTLSLSLSMYKKQNSLPRPLGEILLIFMNCYSTCNKSRWKTPRFAASQPVCLSVLEKGDERREFCLQRAEKLLPHTDRRQRARGAAHCSCWSCSACSASHQHSS